MSNEIWRDIPEYEKIYQVSNYGNIRLYKNNRILKPSDDSCGYLQIVLTKNKKRKSYKIHKLVAKTFIPNPNNYPCVNHKDENKKNNFVENLEFCTIKYNCNYGTRTYRCTKHCFHKVNQYDGLFTLMNTYNSLKEAQEKTGIKYQSISACCRGIIHSSGGWIWRYADE